MKKRLKKKIFKYAWKIGFLEWCEKINKTERKYYLKCKNKYESYLEAEWMTIRREIE